MASDTILAAIEELELELGRIRAAIIALKIAARIEDGDARVLPPQRGVAAKTTGGLACPECEKPFKNAWGLKVHRARVHGGTPAR